MGIHKLMQFRRCLPNAYCDAFGGKGTVEALKIASRQWMSLNFFSSTLFLWAIAIDFTGLSIHDFQVSIVNPT